MASKLYVPCSALQDEDIRSLVEIISSKKEDRVDMHGGRKAALKYLLNIQAAGRDLSKYIKQSNLDKLKDEINKLKGTDPYRKEFDESHRDNFEQYWELKLQSGKIHQLALTARQYIEQSEPFSRKQLKVYFNPIQIDNIPYSQATFEACGFVDEDARTNMIQHPIAQRHNAGKISTVQGRIEEVIFDVPNGKQIIVLDFADERMPGGLFLYGANTQEETICYHSNAYGALLDFKYQYFDGGFMIPEFGCLYVKNVRFYHPKNKTAHRSIDLVAAACYDLTREHGLHCPPRSNKEIYENTEKKLKTVIAASQANSEGNGNNTYLIIGPIGCGAFRNDLQVISKLWANIFSRPLNQTTTNQYRHAFEEIWFLSGKEDKLTVFEKCCEEVFHEKIVQRFSPKSPTPAALETTTSREKQAATSSHEKQAAASSHEQQAVTSSEETQSFYF